MPATNTPGVDFTYHTGDTYPPFDLKFYRNGDVVDLTDVSSINFYVRKSGASANALAGAMSVLAPASAGVARQYFSTLSVGSTGFSAPGLYEGQAEVSWSGGQGRETIRREFSVQVDLSYRTS